MGIQQAQPGSGAASPGCPSPQANVTRHAGGVDVRAATERDETDDELREDAREKMERVCKEIENLSNSVRKMMLKLVNVPRADP